MSAEVWTREIEVDGAIFNATCIRRPFREGIELQVELPSGILTVAELGLGELALLEKAKQLVRDELRRGSSGSA